MRFVWHKIITNACVSHFVFSFVFATDGNFDMTKKKQFLSFTTGSDLAPVGGSEKVRCGQARWGLRFFEKNAKKYQ